VHCTTPGGTIEKAGSMNGASWSALQRGGSPVGGCLSGNECSGGGVLPGECIHLWAEACL
jgi:hypothetical protein